MILREDYKKQLPPKPQPAFNFYTGLKTPLQLILLVVKNFFLKRKWILYVIFIFLFCFLGYLKVFGTAPLYLFSDNFNSYTTNQNIVGQDDWTGGGQFIVRDTDCYEGKCIRNNQEVLSYAIKSGEPLSSDSFFSIFLKFGGFSGTPMIFLWFFSSDNNAISYIVQDSSRLRIGATGDFISEPLSLDTWYELTCEFVFSPKQLRCKIDDNSYTGWNSFYDNGANDLEHIQYQTTILNDSADNIGFISCYERGEETCESFGCCLHYTAFKDGIAGNYGFECSNCPTGECGVGYIPENCNNCLTQGECEAITNCYWNSDIPMCLFGTGVCGEGLELVFCNNQSDCENAGGNWYSNFCFLYPKPTYFIDFNDYYTEYGDYASPSAFVLSIASPTNDLFSGLGGFVESFNTTFDLQTAYTRGKVYGSAIPLARSYLKALDSFAGNLPIGEFFVFALVFMLAVGVFRALKGLFQLVKFW